MPHNKYSHTTRHTIFNSYTPPAKDLHSKRKLRFERKAAAQNASAFIFKCSGYKGTSTLITLLLLSMVIVSLVPPTMAQQPHVGGKGSTRPTPNVFNNSYNATQSATMHTQQCAMVSEPLRQLSQAVIVQDVSAARYWLQQNTAFNHLRIKVEDRPLSLMDMALLQRDLVMAKILLAHGGEIVKDNMLYVIGNAIEKDDLGFVKDLLSLGIRLTDSSLAQTLFPLACAKGRLKFVKYFLEERIFGEINSCLFDKGLLNAAKNHQKQVIHYLQEQRPSRPVQLNARR